MFKIERLKFKSYKENWLHSKRFTPTYFEFLIDT